VNIYHTDPLNPDTDGDGRTDGQEAHENVYTATIYITGTVYITYSQVITTSPTITDTDSDGFSDGQELLWGLNPRSPDTDSDGIPDGIEVTGDSYQSCSSTPCNTDDAGIDALDRDSDDDNIPDAVEWDDGSPNDHLCSNNDLNTDLDGIPNCQDNDADDDNVPNYRDLNSDTYDNGMQPDPNDENTDDSDSDGIPNFLDSDPTANLPRLDIFLPLIIKNK
jgi:hypothetical protein